MKVLSEEDLYNKELVFNEIMYIDVIEAIKRDEEKGLLEVCPYNAEECINRNLHQRNKCNCLEHIVKIRRCPFYKDYRIILKELWDK